MHFIRHIHRFIGMGAAAAVLLTADFASAQHRGGNYYGGGPFPFYGYNGFYSNGFSMYGPPVPTFGPVPGIYGGSDQQFRGAPPSQRYYPSADYPPPGARKLPPTLLEEPVVEGRNDPAQNRTSAAIEVRLPTEDAEVFFDGDKTGQTGQVRVFTSPGLEPGKVYTYEVRARWYRNRDVVNMTQKISVTPGQRVTVDFNAMLGQPQRVQ
jgi:uncharacterized protein (TIGR03000 family)